MARSLPSDPPPSSPTGRIPGRLPVLPTLALVAAVAGLPGGASVAAQGKPEPPSPPPAEVPRGALEESPGGERVELVDRIVAVVDQEPILDSQVRQVIELGLVERGADEGPLAFERRVLARLVAQRLRYQEVVRFGFPGVSVPAIEAAVEEVRARFESPRAWQRYLEQAGTTEVELSRIVARQLAVLEYVDQRLGPRVFVGLEDIRTFYQEELLPEMASQGVRAPPLEEVRETIRELLRERRLNEEIDRWTEDLRRNADVEILVGDYPEELPPVILFWDRPLEEMEEPPKLRSRRGDG